MFINNHRHCWPVRLQCHVLQVSASGYYAWLKRPEPQLSDDERKLVRAMREIDEKSNHTFGSRRMYKELRRGNLVAGRHKMRRLMREDGIRVKRTPRRALVQTTDSQHQHPVADNRLNRNFTVTKPNTVWAADITYVQTNANSSPSRHSGRPGRTVLMPPACSFIVIAVRSMLPLATASF